MGKPPPKWHWSERDKTLGLIASKAVVRNSIHRQIRLLSLAFSRRLLNQPQHSAVGGDSCSTKNSLHSSTITFATSRHSRGQGRSPLSAVVIANSMHVIANATLIIIILTILQNYLGLFILMWACMLYNKRNPDAILYTVSL